MPIKVPLKESMKDFKARPDELAGKVILVTGAGDGIGKTAAGTFARFGATVILLGKTQAKLEQVYDGIAAAGCPEPVIQPMDLETAGKEHYQQIAEAIEEQFGRLDGLLHNAALLGPRTPIANYPEDKWEQVMRVNINAEFMLTKTLLPVLEQSESASILFTTSSVGRTGRAFWGAYAVSKFAVEGFCQVLAEELDSTSTTRVNCINPGATRTRMRAAAYPAENPASVKTPESFMNCYLYLMSDASRGQSGKSFDV